MILSGSSETPKENSLTAPSKGSASSSPVDNVIPKLNGALHQYGGCLQNNSMTVDVIGGIISVQSSVKNSSLAEAKMACRTRQQAYAETIELTGPHMENPDSEHK